MKVKTLTVKVTYRVGLGNIDMPKKVFDQLLDAGEQGKAIDPCEEACPEAAEWLSEKIKERDCMDWECEIDDID